jgi:DNA polymerase I-like protein with 3'-5' exonuclease and polymerase domains
MLIPWTLPAELPDLSGAPLISLDIETFDPELTDKGPGVRRGGYIVGIAVGVPGGRRWYLPFGHSTGVQFPREKVLDWARVELCRPGQAKVGANLLYDLDFLTAAGVPVTGPFYDVQIAEPLIDENAGRYNLDALGEKYLGEKKDVSLLETEVRRRGLRGNVQSHIWEVPPEFVGPYAEKDVDLPLRILKLQSGIMDEQGLKDLFILESKLIPLLLQMRQTGVRVNIRRAKQVGFKLRERLDVALVELETAAGQDVDIWAAASIAQAFDRAGIEYPRTSKTDAPSFKKEWLERHPSRLANIIAECRRLDKFIGTFIDGMILGNHIGGRIHCEFNQLRSDDYGTVSGRLSSSHPNLQQVPKRDDELGPLVRSIFIPEPGQDWGRTDYSQIEYRLLAHYGTGPGSDYVREMYRKNPDVDFHQICADRAGIKRGQAKNLNFAVVYGAGVDKTAVMLGGVDREQARAFLESYHTELPFIKGTARIASRRADDRGWIKTILGRRRRFNTWEPADFELSKKADPMENRQAMSEWVQKKIDAARAAGTKIPRAGVRRAGTYKALNSLIQGSAADLLKKAMVDCYDAGIFREIAPLLTVHDEIDASVPRTKVGKQAFAEMVRIMETAIPLRVPVLVESKIGRDWGKCS